MRIVASASTRLKGIASAVQHDVVTDIDGSHVVQLKKSMLGIAEVVGNAVVGGGCAEWIKACDKAQKTKATMKEYFNLGENAAARFGKDKKGNHERTLMRAIEDLQGGSEVQDEQMSSLVKSILEEAKDMTKNARVCGEGQAHEDLLKHFKATSETAEKASFVDVVLGRFVPCNVLYSHHANLHGYQSTATHGLDGILRMASHKCQ